jgi:putative ABC transport system permease protein
VSFAGVVLIYLYVSNELSFDRFHENGERIYRMYAAYAKPGDAIEEFADTPPNLGPLLSQKFDGIQSATRVFSGDATTLVRNGDQSFNEHNVYTVDSSFFHVFSGQFITGNNRNALSQPNAVVISRSSADRIFGSWTRAFDRELKINNGSYTISAVVEDFPANSHFHFSYLLSIDYAKENLQPGNWLSHWPATYVLLDPNAEAHHVQEQLRLSTEEIFGVRYIGSAYGDRCHAHDHIPRNKSSCCKPGRFIEGGMICFE